MSENHRPVFLSPSRHSPAAVLGPARQIFPTKLLLLSGMLLALILSVSILGNVARAAEEEAALEPCPDVEPASLASDCAVLLAVKESMDLDVNWSTSVPMSEWSGVRVDDYYYGWNNHRVDKVNLSGLGIDGEISPLLAQLPGLRILNLGWNQLSGEIPSELGSLPNLRHLILKGNKLSGEIPSELGNLSNLKFLLLSLNELTGEIPPELGNLSKLEWLELDDNKLSGTIPSELGKLSMLEELDVSSNNLKGAIPPKLGALSKLEILLLDSNQLSGDLPAELGNLSSSLHTLRIDSTNLTGCVPDSLRDMAQYYGHLPFCEPEEDPPPIGNSASRAISASLGNILQDNQPPQFSKDSYRFNLRENRGRGWQSPKGKISVSDPDGSDDAISYAITDGNPGCSNCGIKDNEYSDSLFRVANNARITYQGSGEDYESFPSGQAKYVLTLTATDEDGASASTTVTINIKDVAD